MSWTLITSGGKGKESPFYREFLITSASDLQNEPDMSIATGSIACIVGSGLAMAHKYMKGQNGQWTEIPADVFDVQINGTSITQNGVANIPLASIYTTGVVGIDNSYGIWVNNGKLSLNKAITSDIDNRSFSSVMTPNYMPYGVKSVMSAPVSATDPEWNASEQLAARQRLGIDRDWVLKGTLTESTTSINLDLSNCTELRFLIKAKGLTYASGNPYIIATFENLVENALVDSICSSNSYRVGYYEYVDFDLGIKCTLNQYRNDNSSYRTNIYNTGFGYTFVDGKKISEINKISIANYTNVESAEIKIYAR